MPDRSCSPLQTLVRRFASTPPGTWFFSVTAHHLDRMFIKLSGGRKTLVHIVSGLPGMFITTTGAKSGLPRTTPLVYVRDVENPGRFAIIASNFGRRHLPGWYYNLKAHPQAECMIDGQVCSYLAREIDGEEYARFWEYTLETYRGYLNYQHRAGRRVPIMLLTPSDGS